MYKRLKKAELMLGKGLHGMVCSLEQGKKIFLIMMKTFGITIEIVLKRLKTQELLKVFLCIDFIRRRQFIVSIF